MPAGEAFSGQPRSGVPCYRIDTVGLDIEVNRCVGRCQKQFEKKIAPELAQKNID